jgi:ferredoxin/flavodoxin---NADP+ reductase
MTHVITRACCSDATCVVVCPVDCIHPTPDEPDYGNAEMLYIDPGNCIDCGACVDVCPVDAISPLDELTGATGRFAEINAHYFADRNYPRQLAEQPPPRSRGTAPRSGSTAPRSGSTAPRSGSTAPRPEPLRVAIVGSGPAACYAADELLSTRGLDVEVHMFERLPTPWGLVRSGVAPDHPDTKAVSRLFQRTAAQRHFTFHLNVEVGAHVSHAELMAHHHAVLYAVGATGDRRLDIPGEHLPGSHSATDFVGWYNGHPDQAGHRFDLSGERAVVVGNGNVALDLARILVADVAELARTDIADHALTALRRSRITEVVVLGRRGPAQAAYTTPELLALMQLPGVDIEVHPDEAALDPLTTSALREHPEPMVELKARLVAELAARTPGVPARGRRRRRVRLRYLCSPLELLGADRVRGVRVGRNELARGSGSRLDAVDTGHAEDLGCGLVLRAVGYRGAPVPGLPFDQARGTLPNRGGRVIDLTNGQPIIGVYAAGWIKRGPSGVIGTNRKCARDTAQALLADHAAGRLVDPDANAGRAANTACADVADAAESLRELIARRQQAAVDYAGWKAIDAHERSAGGRHGRPRVKLVRIADLIQVAGPRDRGGPRDCRDGC